VWHIARLFALGLDVTEIAALSGLNRNTVNHYLRGIRERVAVYRESQSQFSGEIEVDEYYFGARRIKGKRGRGAFGKTAVYGVFKANGCV